jgi:hypothetical protein
MSNKEWKVSRTIWHLALIGVVTRAQYVRAQSENSLSVTADELLDQLSEDLGVLSSAASDSQHCDNGRAILSSFDDASPMDIADVTAQLEDLLFGFGDAYASASRLEPTLPACVTMASLCAYDCEGTNCAEIFNCDADESNDCDPNSTCNHDGPGLHSCACNAGYSGDGTTCDDTNGCANSPCFDHADVTCHDTPAPDDGFTCDNCPSGWNGDGITCTDIDDCVGDPCGAAAAGTCADTGANSYECTCSTGYTATGGTCAEIFNCDADESNDCDPNSTCNHDGPGLHSCACNAGYSGDGTTCDDTNGCANSPCFDHADVTCHDTPGAPTASCSSGPEFMSRSQAVTDTCCNEEHPCVSGLPTTCSRACAAVLLPMQTDCASFATMMGLQDVIDTAAAECQAAPDDGFTCDNCPSGWNGDGITCTDIDDCVGDPCGAVAAGTCADTGANSYECTCSTGYTATGGGSTCAPARQACAPGADISGILPLSESNGQEGTLVTDQAAGDGVVNVEDILAVLSQYLREGCGNFADLTGPNGVADCVVGVDDLLYVLSNFRCTPTTPGGDDQGR